jgi:hypothetical protein
MKGTHDCRWLGCHKTRCITGYCREHSQRRHEAIRRYGYHRAGLEPWRYDKRPQFSTSGRGL